MQEVRIKPLSVNQVWQGKRFKTKKYKDYERDVMLLLPKIKIPDGKIRIQFEFGFSSKLADIDNPVKPFMDILQKKYGFDDRRVYELVLQKTDVKKGDEFIRFFIDSLD